MKEINDLNNSTKTCKVCGVEKPLACFILDSVSYIKKYGYICDHCRSKTVRPWIDQTAQSSKDVKKPLSIDQFYYSAEYSFKKIEQPIDKLFKKSSETWAKIIAKQNEDDDDEGGSGGKVRKHGVDYYGLLYAKQKQEQKIHFRHEERKHTNATRNTHKQQSDKASQSQSDKRARKASRI